MYSLFSYFPFVISLIICLGPAESVPTGLENSLSWCYKFPEFYSRNKTLKEIVNPKDREEIIKEVEDNAFPLYSVFFLAGREFTTISDEKFRRKVFESRFYFVDLT